MTTAMDSCKMLVKSDLVPPQFKVSKDNPEEKAVANTLIAMDMASRLGANPLMVMQNLYVVHGRPSWSSSFLIGTINTCGRFFPLKFQFATEGDSVTIGGKQYPNYTCYAYTYAKEDSKRENILMGTKITMAMALAEGWASKPGSKWVTMPQQMLMYRAASFWVRAYAPEISMGMRTQEEAYDMYEDATVIEEIADDAPSTMQEMVEKKLSAVQQPNYDDFDDVEAGIAADQESRQQELDLK